MNSMTTESAACEIFTTRVVNAPRERVFRAWTDPATLADWWGPNGFTNTIHTFELKPEGVWDFTMHGPDGQDFHNSCVFREIVPNERLVFDHLKEMHFYHAEVTFSDVAGGSPSPKASAEHRTRIDWSMRFNTAEELEPIRKFIMDANEQNLDKLESELIP